MPLLRHHAWSEPDNDGVAYGPQQDFTYDNDQPGQVSSAWTQRDGTDVNLTAPDGVGVSFTEREATIVARALANVTGRIKVSRFTRLTRMQLAAVGLGVAMVGGYTLAAWPFHVAPSPSSATRSVGDWLTQPGGDGGGEQAIPTETHTVTATPEARHSNTKPAPEGHRKDERAHPDLSASPDRQPEQASDHATSGGGEDHDTSHLQRADTPASDHHASGQDSAERTGSGPADDDTSADQQTGSNDGSSSGEDTTEEGKGTGSQSGEKVPSAPIGSAAPTAG